MTKRFNNSILKGRMGNVVFYEYNGKQCMRTVAQHIKNPRTPAQQLQRAKLREATQWFKPLVEVNKLGFVEAGKTMCFRRAVSTAMANAMDVIDGRPCINVSQASVAHGNLAPMVDGMMSTHPRPVSENDGQQMLEQVQHMSQHDEKTITITWSPNAKGIRSRANDQLVWVLYDIEHDKVVSNAQCSPKPQRHHGSCLVTWPPEMEPGTYHVYTFFINADATKSSDSVYLGEVVL